MFALGWVAGLLTMIRLLSRSRMALIVVLIVVVLILVVAALFLAFIITAFLLVWIVGISIVVAAAVGLVKGFFDRISFKRTHASS
jgi:hypothetical protein